MIHLASCSSPHWNICMSLTICSRERYILLVSDLSIPSMIYVRQKRPSVNVLFFSKYGEARVNNLNVDMCIAAI